MEVYCQTPWPRNFSLRFLLLVFHAKMSRNEHDRWEKIIWAWLSKEEESRLTNQHVPQTWAFQYILQGIDWLVILGRVRSTFLGSGRYLILLSSCVGICRYSCSSSGVRVSLRSAGTTTCVTLLSDFLSLSPPDFLLFPLPPRFDLVMGLSSTYICRLYAWPAVRRVK